MNFDISMKVQPFNIFYLFLSQKISHATFVKFLQRVKNFSIKKEEGRWKFIVNIEEINLRILTRWTCLNPDKSNILGKESDELINVQIKNIFDILFFGYNFEIDEKKILDSGYFIKGSSDNTSGHKLDKMFKKPRPRQNVLLSLKNMIINFLIKLLQIALVRMVKCKINTVSIEFEKFNTKRESKDKMKNNNKHIQKNMFDKSDSNLSKNTESTKNVFLSVLKYIFGTLLWIFSTILKCKKSNDKKTKSSSDLYKKYDADEISESTLRESFYKSYDSNFTNANISYGKKINDFDKDETNIYNEDISQSSNCSSVLDDDSESYSDQNEELQRYANPETWNYDYVSREKAEDLNFHDEKTMILRQEGKNIDVNLDYLPQEKFKFTVKIDNVNQHLWCCRESKISIENVGIAKDIEIIHKMPFTLNMLLAEVLSSTKIIIKKSKFFIKKEIMRSQMTFIGNFELITGFTKLIRVFYEKKKNGSDDTLEEYEKKIQNNKKKIIEETLNTENDKNSIFVRQDLIPMKPKKVQVYLRSCKVFISCENYNQEDWNVDPQDTIVVKFSKLKIINELLREGKFMTPKAFSNNISLKLAKIKSYIKDTNVKILQVVNVEVSDCTRIEKLQNTINHEKQIKMQLKALSKQFFILEIFYGYSKIFLLYFIR